MLTMPKTIGVFAGLVPCLGEVRLQRREEKGSIVPGATYKGDWELSGGKVEEGDIFHALTFEVLAKHLTEKVRQKLGIDIKVPRFTPFYLTILDDPAKGICDWAFMITIPPGYWNTRKDWARREIIDCDPTDLRALANRPKGDQLLSGWGKRMCRMALGAIVSFSGSMLAGAMLDEVKPDWRETEFFVDADEALLRFRRILGQNYGA